MQAKLAKTVKQCFVKAQAFNGCHKIPTRLDYKGQTSTRVSAACAHLCASKNVRALMHQEAERVGDNFVFSSQLPLSRFYTQFFFNDLHSTYNLTYSLLVVVPSTSM